MAPTPDTVPHLSFFEPVNGHRPASTYATAVAGTDRRAISVFRSVTSSSVSLTLSTQLHSVPDRFSPTLERQDGWCRDVGIRETLAPTLLPFALFSGVPYACLSPALALLMPKDKDQANQ